jgi:hypothetical protein
VVGLFRLSLEFGGQLCDFELEGLVFSPLAVEEAGGEAGLGLDAFGGEQVGVGDFVAAVAEVLDLEPTPIDDGAVAVAPARPAPGLPRAGLSLLHDGA